MFKELDEKYRYKTVKYKGCDQYQCNYGGNSDPRKYLTEGNLYKVSDVEVGSWSTALFLEGFGSKSFNSVCFEVV